jgi:hypothetical protein
LGGRRAAQGLHPKHREYVVVPKAEGGEHVDLLIEAAANPFPPFGTSPWPLFMADYDGAPVYRLTRAELAVVDRDVEALFYDLFVLRKLVDELPEGSTRRAEIVDALAAACDAIEPDDVSGSVVAARAESAPALARRAAPDAHLRQRDRQSRTSTARGCGRSARRNASVRARSPTRCGSWTSIRNTDSRRRRRSSTRG